MFEFFKSEESLQRVTVTKSTVETNRFFCKPWLAFNDREKKKKKLQTRYRFRDTKKTRLDRDRNLTRNKHKLKCIKMTLMKVCRRTNT